MKTTYIIPLHKFDDSVKELLPNALKSVKDTGKDYTVLIVGPKDVIEQVEPVVSAEKMKTSVKYAENEGETDFATQVNTAVMKCTTKFFSVLEYDDTITEYWPSEAEKYAESENASVILPLCEFIKDGEMVSFGNELAWHMSYANTPGIIDFDCLDKFMDFNVTGAFIKTEDFISIGGLKPSLKIASWYEFLLRACKNSLKVYVAPKLGYSHTIWRKGSYMDVMKDEISADEGAWLIETARQEYFFKDDRNKKFGE